MYRAEHDLNSRPYFFDLLENLESVDHNTDEQVLANLRLHLPAELERIQALVDRDAEMQTDNTEMISAPSLTGNNRVHATPTRQQEEEEREEEVEEKDMEEN